MADLPYSGAVQSMEPRPTTYYGQILSPWTFWRPADDQLRAARASSRSDVAEDSSGRGKAERDWTSRDGNWHIPAAYLLARWGTGETRSRGRQALEHVARSSRAFYTSIDAIRPLHALRDPYTAALIRLTAPRVPDTNDLKPSYLLRMAIGLQQLGEKDYGPLVDDAIRLGLPHVRLEAVQFLGSTEDLFHVPQLVKLLEDRTAWSGRVVADVALESLRQLTLQDLPADGAAWQTWLSQHQEIQRRTLVERWIADKGKTIAKVPMGEANAWIARLSTTTDPRILPVISAYLGRKDLDPQAAGPGWRGYGGGGLPRRFYGPPVVTLLLRLAQLGMPGAVAGLEQCLKAAHYDIRIFGALALAAYQRPRADEALARNWPRTNAGSVPGPRSSCSTWAIDAGFRYVSTTSSWALRRSARMKLAVPLVSWRAVTCAPTLSSRCRAMPTPHPTFVPRRRPRGDSGGMPTAPSSGYRVEPPRWTWRPFR